MNTLKKTILISVAALALCAFSNQNFPKHNIAPAMKSPITTSTNGVAFFAQGNKDG